MSDEKIQAWLDDNPERSLEERPADPALAAYEKLFQVLAAEPEGELLPGFAARVVARVRAEEAQRAARYVNLAGAVVIIASFMILVRYIAHYVNLDLGPSLVILRDLFLPVIVSNQTWIITAIVCGALTVIDRWVAATRS